MFSKSMRAVYGRLLIFGLLSMCLFVFGYSDMSENVSATAAPCTQDCEANLNRCTDSCSTSCDEASTDTECDDCVIACYDRYFSCLSIAVSCNKAVSYTPNCQVDFGDHCPLDANGNPDCSSPDVHQGYYQTCTTTVGNQPCVVCPNGEYCPGGGGIMGC